MALICNVPTAFDKFFVKAFPSKFSPQRIADIRAKIEMETGVKIEKITLENQQLIIDEMKRQREEVVNAVRSKGNLKTKSYGLLRFGVPSSIRRDIISAISYQFSLETSRIADRIRETKGLNPDRLDITMGITLDDGTTKYGEAVILDIVLDTFYNTYGDICNELSTSNFTGILGKVKEKELLNKKKAFETAFKYWPQFVALARENIKTREGLVSNNEFTYSEEASFENFVENLDSYDPEMSQRESWQLASEERDPFASVGMRVRRILASLPVYKVSLSVAPNTIVNLGDVGTVTTTQTMERTVLGTAKFMEVSSTHKMLVELLRGVKNSDELYERLKSLNMPWVKPILSECDKDPYFRVQLFCDLKRNFQYYSTIAQDRKAKSKSLKVNILNEEKAYINLDRFISQLTMTPSKVATSSTIFNDAGYIDEENLNKTIKAIFDNFTEKNIKMFNNRDASQRAYILKSILDSLGIQADYVSLLTMIRTGKTRQLTQALIDLANYGISGLKGLSDSVSFADILLTTKEDNPTLSGVADNYKKIIKIINKYNPVVNKLYKVRSKNAKGIFADRYSDVNPSFMGTLVETIMSYAETDDKAGLRNFLENNYFNNSTFARINPEWDKNEENLSKKYIIYNAVLRGLWEQATSTRALSLNLKVIEGLSADDVVSENLSSKQHAISQILYYFSEVAGTDQAFYPVFILGDSNKLKYISGKKYNNNSAIYKEFYQMFRREIERAKQMEAFEQAVKKQGYKSPGWMYDYNKNNRNNELSILKVMQPVLQGKKLSEVYMTEEEFIKAFDTIIREQAKESFKFFENLKVFEQNDKGEYINLRGTGLTQKDIEEKWLNYFLNNKLAMAQQLNILDIDTIYAENSKDLQKRNKQNHASGTSLDVKATWEGESLFENEEDAMETIAYFDDIAVNTEETNPEFMKVIAKRFGENSSVYRAYSKNKRGKNAVTLTDGQGYRTLTSYRKVMIMKGSWTKKMEEAYQKIQSLKTAKPEDRDKILEEVYRLAVIFQPLKPFTYTHEKINYGTQDGRDDVMTIPVQVKYAEAVLIPELLPEGTLKTMAEWMDENGIDVMASTKCVKMGMHCSISLPKISDMSDKEAKSTIREALTRQLIADDGGFKLGVHKLSYEDYRVQTNVPPHTDVARSIGTQIRKLIMSDLTYGVRGKYSHYFDSFGKAPRLFDDEAQDVIDNVDAGRLVNIYNSLIITNILTAFNKFEQEIRDNKKLAKLLQNTALNSDRVSIDNLFAFGITGDEKFLIPLFEGSLEHDTIAEILSIFRKKVNKQQMRGGSAVQVSAMGIQGFEEDKNLKVVTDGDNNCLYAECEIPFDFSYTDEFGVEHELDYNYYCNIDGTFKKDKEGNILLEKHFPGILDIIAYRVPTERNYSTINLKVVRCSPKQAGGTIKVPAQYTVTAGFDFDIDKLYLLRKDFAVRSRNYKEDRTILRDIWSEVYADSNMYDRLVDTQISAYAEWKNISYHEVNVNSNSFQNFAKRNPLYTFWDIAGGIGTAQEAFDSYLERNPDRAEALANMRVYSDKIEDLNWEEYDPDLIPEKQSTAARNNMLHHIMRMRLMDEETLESRYRPGGFTESSLAARIMRELTLGKADSLKEALDNSKDENSDPEPSYDPTNPETMIIYNQMNQVAGKLIGVFANQNINHALASLAKSITLKKPIKFDGHLEEGYSDLLHNPDGIDTFRTVAEFLAASVDAVKDPVLNYLNFNNLTANAAGLLARLGYSPTEIGLLFNQPLIKEVCEKAQNDGTTLTTAIKSIKKKYTNDFGAFINDKFDDTNIEESSSENLAAYLVKQRAGNIMSNERLAEIQFKLLNLFESIVDTADELNDFVKVTKFTAANSVGSTIGDIYEQKQSVEDYLNRIQKESNSSNISIVLNDDTNIPINTKIRFKRRKSGDVDIADYRRKVHNNPFGYEQCMFDCIQSLPSILSGNFPYETKLYTQMRNLAKKFVVSKKGRLKAATINSMDREIIHYLLATRSTNFSAHSRMPKNNMLYSHDNQEYSNGEYYRYQFGADFLRFIEDTDFKSKYPNIYNLVCPSIQQITTRIKTEDGYEEAERPMVVLNPASGRGHDIYRQDVKDIIKEEFEELAKDKPQAAFGLYFYNYYKMGFSFGGNSFLSYFPVSLIYSLPLGKRDGKTVYYTDFLSEMLDGHDTADISTFMQQYILNHLDDNTFIYTLNKEASEEFNKLRKGNTKTVTLKKSYFTETLGESKVFNPVVKEEETTGINITTWAPVIAVRNSSGKYDYYMANLDVRTGDLMFNQSPSESKNSGAMTYTKVTPLGEAGKTTAYGDNVEDARTERELKDSEDIFNVQESELLDRDPEYEAKPVFKMIEDLAETTDYSLEKKNRALIEKIKANIDAGRSIYDDEGDPIC